jgi:hypothetical protein
MQWEQSNHKNMKILFVYIDWTVGIRIIAVLLGSGATQFFPGSDGEQSESDHSPACRSVTEVKNVRILFSQIYSGLWRGTYA